MEDFSSQLAEIRLSLVVLCFGAGAGIVPVVKKLHRMLSFYKFPYELILVANYIEDADDSTPRIVAELAGRLPHTRVVSEPKKGMMGWDMRKGLEAASGEYICIIDGDGQFPFEYIFSCLLKIEMEDLDMVKTYRVDREDGLYRKGISIVYNFIFRRLFGTPFMDVNSKPKIIRRSKYRLMDLRSNDWFIDAEIMICAHELGLKVAEIPIHFYANNLRKSFVKPEAIIEFIRNLWTFRFNRPGAGPAAPSGPA